MSSSRSQYALILITILCLYLSGCSILEIDEDNSNSRLPTSKAVSKYITKYKIQNIVHTENICNKYTIIIYEKSSKEYGYYITTSYYGRVVEISHSEHEYGDAIPDFNIEYRISTPEFALIKIDESRLSDISKIIVRYTDQNDKKK